MGFRILIETQAIFKKSRPWLQGAHALAKMTGNGPNYKFQRQFILLLGPTWVSFKIITIMSNHMWKWCNNTRFNLLVKVSKYGHVRGWINLYYPPNLVIGTIFNHSSYRDAILQFDFFGLKDRWPTDSTIWVNIGV